MIGVVLDEAAGGSGQFSMRPFYALRMDYFRAVSNAGGVPVGVGYDRDDFEDLLSRCDGWLIPGGDYRFPAEWYAARPPGSIALDVSPRASFERYAVDRILAADRPVLGVCNGMQVMCGLRGGKMEYRESSDGGAGVVHSSSTSTPAGHAISVIPDTRTHDLLGTRKLEVNSYHRECVVSAGDQVRVSAVSDDGVIEAIELDGLRFALGVQWHPELDSHTGKALFGGLIAAAGKD